MNCEIEKPGGAVLPEPAAGNQRELLFSCREFISGKR